MTLQHYGRHGQEGEQPALQQIELEISELVLHGFPYSDRYRTAAAIESELARLIAEGGVPAAWSRGADLQSLDGNAVKVPAGARPDHVGRLVAREIYGRMKR